MISNKKDSYANFEKFFPYLMETIDDLVIIASADNSFKIEHIYEGEFLDQLGYSKDKLVGEPLLKFIHFGDGVSEKNFIELVNQEKSKQNIQILRRNSKTIWTELRSRRFLDENDRQKVIFKLCNISKIKDLETKINESEKLEEAEGKYRLIYENANDLIRVLNEKLEFEYINENVHKSVLGYSKEEFIGKNQLSLYHPEDRKKATISVGKILRKGDGSYQARLKHQDGSYRWFEFSPKTFIDSAGARKTISIARDITERKQIEEKIKESELRYRDLFENSPIALMEQDFSELKRYIDNLKEKGINDFEKFFDDNPEEILKCMSKVKVVDVNKKILDVYKANEKEDFIRKMNQLSTSIDQMTNEVFLDNRNEMLSLIKGVTKYESEIITKSEKGDTIYIYAKTLISPGFENTWSKVIVSIIDITNRKITEQKLIESEEKYRTITDQSILGITILQDDVIKYINHKGADLIGYTVDEIRNWSPNEYAMSIHPEDRQLAIEQARKKQLREPKVINHYQFRCLKKTGETIWIDNYSKTIDYEGKPADLVTAIDITEMKKAQQALKDSEGKYRHLYESSPYAILLINMEGKIIDCNLTSERLSGFSRNELIGMSFANTSFIPKEHIYSVLKDFKTLIKNKVIEPREIQLYTNEKITNWVSYQASIFSIENQKIIQVMIENINERKSAEEKLKESEAKYHELFETSPDGVILTDLQGIILECNSALEQLTDYSSNEFIGKNFRSLNIYQENGLQILLKGYKNLLTENRLEAVEIPIKTKENKKKWVQVQSALLNMKGKSYILAVIHDITSVKQAENALKESEQKFRDILETSSVGVMELDVMKKKLLYINPKLLNIMGFAKEELTEEIVRQNIIHPNDLKKLLMTNEEAELEFRITDKQGKLKWLAGKRIPHYNENGEITSIRVWLDDVTEKKMFENLIYELNINFLNFTADNRNNINLLLNTCLKLLEGDMILYIHKIISDDQENYQIITPEKIYLYNSEEFNQLFMNVLFEEEHDFPQTFIEIDKMTFGKSDPFIMSNQFKGCFGKVIKSHEGLNSAVCIFYKNNPIISGQDKLVLFLICDALEIEQRRWQVQQDLEKQNITLNKINKLKTELFSRTSHELKTPLISVKGFTELLLTLYKSKLDPEIISILNEIKDGGKRLENIINLLLDSTKLEAGQLSLNLQDEDLIFLIKFCVKELQGLAKLRDQSISLNLHNKLETKFDKERIYEVISNLLVNAIKYTPPGGNITIESKINNNLYEISIKDNGIGFTEEEKSQIFQQFGKVERYGQGWDVAADGTGLGLYITKKLVELHGGSVWFESEGRNKGTRFHFTLPIIK